MSPIEKQLREALDIGLTRIAIDTETPGVELPPQFKGQRLLPINLSYNFEKTNMVFDADAIRVTLTFAGKPFRCVIPWQSICTVQVDKPKEKKPKPSFLKVVK